MTIEQTEFSRGWDAGIKHAIGWREIMPEMMPADDVPVELTDGRQCWLGAFGCDDENGGTALFTIGDPEFVDGKWRADIDDYDDRKPTHYRYLPQPPLEDAK